MKKVFVGFQKIITGQVLVTLQATGQRLAIAKQDWLAFVVEQGFVASDATMGGTYIESELLVELGFDLSAEGVAAPCA